MSRCILFVMYVVAVGAAAMNLAGAQSAPPVLQSKQVRVDQFGDPLPEGAVARIGTTRFRHKGMELLGFNADGTVLIYFGGGALHYMDAVTGKETKIVPIGDAEQNPGILYSFGNFQNLTALSGDGKVLASATRSDGLASIFIIETDTGKERRKIAMSDLVNSEQPYELSFDLTNDGKWLLVRVLTHASKINAPGPPPLLILDTLTGQRVREFAPQKDYRFSHARFGLDSRQIAALEHNDANGNTRLRVFDAVRGAELRSVEMPQNNDTQHIDLLLDGQKLLAHNRNGGQIRLYDLGAANQLKEVRAFSNVSGPPFYGISRDGKQLFIADNDRIHQWDIGGGEVRQIEDPNLGINAAQFRLQSAGTTSKALALSPDGKLLAFAGAHGAVIFDTHTGKRKSGGGGDGTVGSIRFTPDASGLIVTASEHSVKLWDIPSGKLRQEFARFENKSPPRQFRDEFSGMLGGRSAFSADGKLFAVAAFGNGVGVWHAASGATYKTYGSENPVDDRPMPGAFAFAPHGSVLATATTEGFIKLWDSGSSQELRSWTWHPPKNAPKDLSQKAIVTLAFSPDGKTLAGSAVYGEFPSPELIFWETATGKERMRLNGFTKSFSNNGFDITVLLDLLGQMAVSLEYSPDGRQLLVGTLNGCRQIDAFTGKDIVVYAGHLLLGHTATFSADRKLVFFGQRDGTIRALDAATGRVLRDFSAHSEPVVALAISADGKWLASGSTDSTVLFWDVAELSGMLAARPLSVKAKELDGLWNDLASDNAAKAYQAMNALAALPTDAVPFLKARLKTIPPVDQKVIEDLLDDLNSPKFQVRDKANAQLEKLGDLAGPLLRQKLAGTPTLETRQRMERLLAKLNGAVQSPETLQELRAIEVLERIGTRDALEALTPLAKGAPGHRVTVDAHDAVQRLEKQLKGQ
jgi:WD40 repeat protein